jgi:hypothetical protein
MNAAQVTSVLTLCSVALLSGAASPGQPRGDATARSHAADDPYQRCGGRTLHPRRACSEERCVPLGLAARVYAEWKRQFMAAHGLSANEFASQIELSKVELTEGPLYLWVSIQYVFVVDWVRSRQAVSVNLGKHPLPREPDEAVVAGAVALEIKARHRPVARKVVPRSAAETALASCHASIAGDWCGIRFERATGRLLVSGYGIVDRARNRCMGASVDLASGELAACDAQPCFVP